MPLVGTAHASFYRGEVRCPRLCPPYKIQKISLNLRKENPNVPEDPPCPRRHQEASGLPHRGGRQPLAARRPFHRTAWLLQSAAAERKDRAAQVRPREGQGLDGQGRAADRPGGTLPRRCRPHEAREA